MRAVFSAVGSGNEPEKLGPKTQHCSSGAHGHWPPLPRHRQGYRQKNTGLKNPDKMQGKKKQVLLQSFLMTHLQAPGGPRRLARTRQEGNVKNEWASMWFAGGSAAKNSSRAEGLSGNCESSVISGRVHLFGFVSTIKLSSER